MKKRAILIIVLCLSSVLATPCFAAFRSSSPCVNMVAQFISGTKKHPGVFMAIDAREQRKRGGKVLFKGTNISQTELLHAYYDPARLPYVAQAVMRVMSETDKANYTYYQRRLAEFQAALDSAVNVGRYCLPKDKAMLDLTAMEGALILSAHDRTTRPDQSELKRWAEGDVTSLQRLLELSEKKGEIVLIDRWTAAPIVSCLQNYKKKITMPTAGSGKNYFNSLTAIYRYVAKRIKELEK